MSEVLHFKISSGLKNIIGRELINDKYIAIFELVKNSYDAGAKSVTIKFDDIYGKNAKITITDDGKGMNKYDILNKWLFVAYSEKKNSSYRDNLKRKRSYAGAKGVGRFSCDRLGSNVKLLSKTINDEFVHSVEIDWDDFEKDEKENFENINVIYQYDRNEDLGEKGTAIVVSNVREQWDRKEISQLKKSLTQLVNPEATSNYDDFNIFLDVKDEIENDELEENKKNCINGKIENYIFETLNIKTTKITVKIDEDGRYITTSLNDRGTLLFEVKEKNIYTLKNINCVIYHLNRAAKVNFTKFMNVEVVNYGSIFVYKNGFRVYPYGQPGQDFFQIDKRKAQGYNRFLGTREIIGRLEVYGENSGLTETSSRNNGFISSFKLSELIDFFYEFALKPLERYVVNIIRWGEEITEQNIIPTLTKFNNIDEIIKKIKPRNKSENIISTNFNNEIIEIIENRKNKSVSSEVKDIKNIAIATDNHELIKKAEAIEKKTKELQKRATELEQTTTKVTQEIEDTKKELDVTKKQVEILEARADITADEAISAMHIMKTYADAIDSNITEILEEIKPENMGETFFILHEIRQTCSKIMNTYNLVINTRYNAETGVIKDDICKFIKNYVDMHWRMKFRVSVEQLEKICFKAEFNPLEFSIILDNLISNSKKANSTMVTIEAQRYQDKFIDIIISDDGKGIGEEIKNVERFFEPGYTRTGGSGIGLYTVKNYLEKIDGQVMVNDNYVNGFQLIVRLKLWI
ncbi:ATP-binding protein [Clostridium sp. UBA5119]|uniref:ATP-binding protein n=1 Tax=Clostridium sp. UBA5119 TaxID=1946366 RepID=UPI003217B709